MSGAGKRNFLSAEDGVDQQGPGEILRRGTCRDDGACVQRNKFAAKAKCQPAQNSVPGAKQKIVMLSPWPSYQTTA